jgi:hypothetical protein
MMDPVAKDHYDSIRKGKGFLNTIRDDDEEYDEEQKICEATFIADDNTKLSYDPLLLAESLLIVEDEHGDSSESKSEEKREPGVLPVAVPTITRRMSVAGGIKVVKVPHSERKMSAIEEHERVVNELKKMGLFIM